MHGRGAVALHNFTLLHFILHRFLVQGAIPLYRVVKLLRSIMTNPPVHEAPYGVLGLLRSNLPVRPFRDEIPTPGTHSRAATCKLRCLGGIPHFLLLPEERRDHTREGFRCGQLPSNLVTYLSVGLQADGWDLPCLTLDCQAATVTDSRCHGSPVNKSSNSKFQAQPPSSLSLSASANQAPGSQRGGTAILHAVSAATADIPGRALIGS